MWRIIKLIWEFLIITYPIVGSVLLIMVSTTMLPTYYENLGANTTRYISWMILLFVFSFCAYTLQDAFKENKENK